MERKVIVVKPTVIRTVTKGEGYSSNGDDSWLHPEVDEESRFQVKAMAIVKNLTDHQDFPMVKNFYAESGYKQLNLIKYFNALFWIKPSIMFVGEAPGVHGCAHTGIPFTSERIIRQGRLDRHFPGTRFVVESDTYEGSAGYIWEAIDGMSKPPILWNVFPLHPYKIKNGKIKNREPRVTEKEWGKTILQSLQDLFPDVSVISIGNHAKNLCERLGITTSGHLIHPAYHANEFREQFRSQFLSKGKS